MAAASELNDGLGAGLALGNADRTSDLEIELGQEKPN